MPDGTVFLPFSKPGRHREGMTKWELEQAKIKTERAKRWLHACGRKDFSKLEQITKDTYICSLHFFNGQGPTEENPDPVLATLTEKEAEGRMKRRRHPKDRSIDANNTASKKAKESVEEISAYEVEALATGSNQSIDVARFKLPEKSDASTQTIYDKYVLGAKIETVILRNDAKTRKSNFIAKDMKDGGTMNRLNLMSPNVILADRKKSKFFIGLYPDQFEALFKFLGPAKYQLTYWCFQQEKKDNPYKCKSTRSRKFNENEELFLTLLKLRRGFTHQTIAYMYDVSVSLVSSIFTTWIQFIYLHFKELNYLMFPARDILKESLPAAFKSFKNVRCSIDCTEFFCQTPRDYAKQGNLYSSYKHSTTFKALIAVTPNGSACFVSDLYEGSLDDVAITQRCGILDYIEPGDLLLVDKGFRIQDLVHEKQATIKIPPFLGNRSKLTAEEEIETKRIAKARIHIERFNERLKKFMAIGRTIPLSLTPLASQMVYVAACLVNFQEPLCR